MASQIRLVSIHPEFLRAYLSFGVFKSAIEKGVVDVEVVNLRDYAVDSHGTIDDSPYGGGDGMVMRPEPLADAVEALRREMGSAKVMITQPSGVVWDQRMVETHASKEENLIVFCGRFAGFDQRFVDEFVDYEVSLGDFVLAGGELAGLAIIESILRLRPGVLGNEKSAVEDSFSAGMEGGLEYPVYTRPSEFRGRSVPDVLLSGDHKKIAEWRQQESKRKTKALRPDLLS